MFHKKRLYVAIAQTKEERQAYLQRQYAHRMPAGAYHPSVYYSTSSGNIRPILVQPVGMMYPSMGMRPGWSFIGFAPPTRPPFQLSPSPFVSYLILLEFIYSGFTSIATLFIFVTHVLTR